MVDHANIYKCSIAGSETTATTVSCMTYYLLRNPDIMKRLKTEIRTAFTRYEEIDAASTTSLLYLRAVAQEAMRVYPPLPLALPRVVPAGGSTVDGHYVPGGVGDLLFVLEKKTDELSRLLYPRVHSAAVCRRLTSTIRGNSSRSDG